MVSPSMPARSASATALCSTTSLLSRARWGVISSGVTPLSFPSHLSGLAPLDRCTSYTYSSITRCTKYTARVSHERLIMKLRQSLSDRDRRTAFFAGVLFLVTIVASIPGALLYTPLLTDPAYLAGAGVDAQIALGALLE